LCALSVAHWRTIWTNRSETQNRCYASSIVVFLSQVHVFRDVSVPTLIFLQYTSLTWNLTTHILHSVTIISIYPLQNSMWFPPFCFPVCILSFLFIMSTGTLRLPWLKFFRVFSSVGRQMPVYNSQRRITVCILPY
jgi:hypothetical protein